MKTITLLKLAMIPMIPATIVNGTFNDAANYIEYNNNERINETTTRHYSMQASYREIDAVYYAEYTEYTMYTASTPPQQQVQYYNIYNYMILTIKPYAMISEINTINITIGTTTELSFYKTEDTELINYMKQNPNYGQQTFYTQALPQKINTSTKTETATPDNITNSIYSFLINNVETQYFIVKAVKTSYQTAGIPTNINDAIFKYTYTPTTIVNQEVINLPEIMFTVLTMPFAFISQAFNLTLFPNTPYSVNISNLFLAVIAVLIFVFLIKLILSKS